MHTYTDVYPSCWSDGKILELTDSCSLFFIILCAFCDKEGKIQNNDKSISKKTFRWGTNRVQSFLETLADQELVKVSDCGQWIQVIDWVSSKRKDTNGGYNAKV